MGGCHNVPWFSLVWIVLFCATGLNGVYEFFSSMSHMKSLAQGELNTVAQLQEYAENLARDLETWKGIIVSMKASLTANLTTEQRIANSIDQYALLQRWNTITKLLQNKGAISLPNKTPPMKEKPAESVDTSKHNRTSQRLDEPLKEVVSSCAHGPIAPREYQGAILALIRLIRVYNLPIQGVMLGEVMGLQAHYGLDVWDALQMARAAVEMKELGYAAQVFRFILNSTSDGSHLALRHEAGVRLALLYAQRQDFIRSHDIIETVLQGCFDVYTNCSSIEKEDCAGSTHLELMCMRTCGTCLVHYAGDEYKDLQEIIPVIEAAIASNKAQKMNDFVSERKKVESWRPKYEALCRGEEMAANHEGYCQYRQTVVPVVTFKEEVLCDDPRISMIYDVITDREAANVMQLSKDKLLRSALGLGSTSDSIRVSATVFLNDSESLALKLSRRTELITGLRVVTLPTASNMDPKVLISADELQVVNYGLGGHYEPHTDFQPPHLLKTVSKDNPERKLIENSGDRVATFLYYLTDIQGGGRTVFPNMLVSVPPVKNAAAFWFNSKLSGEYDTRTLHAGCPVLLGEKWVCNKWIREYGNEFKRKCGISKHYVSKSGF